MIADSTSPDVTTVPFSWPGALEGKYDVMHVHWPELLLRGTPVRRLFRRAAFVAVLAANRVRGIPMVWTAHNPTPHERSSRSEARLLGLWDRAVSARVFLSNADMPVERRDRDVVIVHGDYATVFGTLTDDRPDPDQVISFGLLRPYKGLESLIAAVANIDAGSRPRAVLAGHPADPVYARKLEALGSGVAEIELDLRYVPDAELARLVRASMLVVLPYREMHHSGAALLALTLGRPVLVTASETMRELASDVGEDWVLRFEGELTGEVLVDALTRARNIPQGALPDLSRRSAAVIARQHVDLYRSLVRA